MSKMVQSVGRVGWCALAALVGGSLLMGCRDEPPSPGGASGSASAVHGRAGEGDPARARGQRVSPEAQKRFRVEVCAFGTLGLLDVRDAYLKSLGGAEPGPKKIPVVALDSSAAETPAADAKAAADAGAPKGPPSVAKAPPSVAAPTPSGSASAPPAPPTKLPPSWMVSSTLPFAQAVRSCSIAKKLAQPPSPELDGEMDRYEQFVLGLDKLLVEARDYYQAKTYETDGFKRGKELHAELIKAFAGLDERVTALGTAVETWHKQLGPATDKLDEAGQLSDKAVDEARALTLLLLGKPEPTKEALGAAIDKVKAATDALEAAGSKDPQAVHPQIMVPALRELLDKAAVAQQQLDGKALTARAVHDVAGRYAGALDASQRALTRLFGVHGGKGRPRLESGPAGRRPPQFRPVPPAGPGPETPPPVAPAEH
jgi:hypothetical protein